MPPHNPLPKVRDGFIDALRAIALVRVTIWHALGIPLLSWTITTMPLMFFVAGSLLYASLDGKDARVVLRRRLKRFLVPFWGFGVLVLSTMAIVDLRTNDVGADFSFAQIGAWIFPLVNPTGSAWEAGWASSPLWYMRAYLWLLLLAPVLVRLWKRFSLLMLAGCAMAAVGVQIVADQIMPGPNHLIWIAGDLGTYGFFALLGFAHREGRFATVRPRALLEWLCIASLMTVAAWKVFPSPDGVVNHSYPALMTLGIAWLCAALLARPVLRHAPAVPIVGPALHWMTRRAMSIYLWHSPCIVAAYWILNATGTPASAPTVLLLMAVLVVVAATATGWLEDVAGNRRAELVPLPHGRSVVVRRQTDAGEARGVLSLIGGAAVGVTIALIAGASLIATDASASSRPASSAVAQDTGTGLALPPPPSGRPDPGQSNQPVVTPPPPATSLQAAVDEWRSQHDVDGVLVGISSPAGQEFISSGSAPTGQVPVTSVTKTMTAAMVLQLVDEGLLTLDGPLPLIAGITDRPSLQGVTVRHLLNHSSGLVPYQQATGYNSTGSLSPATAIDLATATPREWEPGAEGGYSNSGFLVLGALIEHVAGNDFTTELQRRITSPVGLSDTTVDESPRLGWVGGSAGGAVSSVKDLVSWGDALYRSRTVLSPAMLQEMLAVDASLSSGLGAFPICPCSTTPDGLLEPDWIGHNGGSVMLQYQPETDLVVAVSLTESFWTEELTQHQVHDLLRRIQSQL